MTSKALRLPQGSGVSGRASIVVPCHDQAHFLASAVASALEQTHADVEVIVVDDGSRDNTEEVARRFGVTLVRRPNGGLAAARNTGAIASTGEFVTFLDADDRLLPEALAAGIDELERRPALTLAFGHHRVVAYDGSPLAEWRPEPEPQDPYEALLRDNIVKMHGTVVYRRRTLEQFGLFDESLAACEDYDLLLRVARTRPIGSYLTVVAEYRRHGTNMTNDPARMLSTALEVLERQWPWVRESSRLRRAYRDGHRFWVSYYGTPLVEHVRRSAVRHDWREVLRAGRILLRRHPAGASHLVRELAYDIREAGRAARE